MRLVCPCCGAMNSLEALINDGKARAAVSAALALPAGIGDRVIRYLGLFRPQQRGLSWDRVTRILEELNGAIVAAEVQRDGKTYPAPADVWAMALDEVLDRRDKLDLPLAGHGYLFEIVAATSRKSTERRLQQQEWDEERARARQGSRDGRMQNVGAVVAAALSPESPAERAPPPPEFRALAGKLRGLLGAQSPLAAAAEQHAGESESELIE